MKKLKVCVYAISKNESKFVNRFVESMKEADEIYVLDTGSTDETVSLLEQNKVHVKVLEIKPWRFDTARNLSLDMIPDDADICICADLDEVFQKGWRQKLENLWQNNNLTRLKYLYHWSFDEFGNPATTFHINKIHSRFGYTWKHPVHEVLVCEEGFQEKELTTNEIVVDHHPDETKSRSSYLPLLEMSVEEDPEDDRNMHYLGREYMFYQKWDDCIKTLHRHLELPSATWKDERCASMRFIARSYKELKRFDEANVDLMKVNLFVNNVMSFMMPILMFLMNGMSLMIVWFGAKNINNGIMQVGDMMAIIQYTMQIVMAFLMISMVSIMLPRAAISANRIMEILEQDLSIKDKENTKLLDDAKKGLVEFKNVCFKYPDADTETLTDISFTAEPGKTTAIIGSTGSGKSTIVNLIPRFYDVTGGELCIDGVNVKDVSQKSLRDIIGFVPQKGVLFSGTIESNIKFADKNMNDERMIDAARIAQATEFIETKPEKYQAPISQGGTNVSGGQKQRLSIARAIASDPEIYVFDDSFSALDYKTDCALREDLKAVTKDKTVIIVAQRINTVLNADQIITLEDGNIVGKGTHEELMKNCETYRQIALSQLSEEELNKTTQEGSENK